MLLHDRSRPRRPGSFKVPLDSRCLSPVVGVLPSRSSWTGPQKHPTSIDYFTAVKCFAIEMLVCHVEMRMRSRSQACWVWRLYASEVCSGNEVFVGGRGHFRDFPVDCCTGPARVR